MKRLSLLIPLIAIMNIQSLSGAEEPAAAKVGEKAPDFTLTSAEEKTISLSDYEGKDVVLVFSRAHW